MTDDNKLAEIEAQHRADCIAELIAALKAEREKTARLRDALDKILALADGPGALDSRYGAIARDALGGSETPRSK